MAKTLDSIVNLRHLGDLCTQDKSKTAPDILYRSGSLDSISGSDEIRLTKELKIKTVIDLRTAEEREWKNLQEQQRLPGIRSHHISIIAEGKIGKEPFPDGSEPLALAESYFMNLIEATKQISDVVKIIADGLSRGERVLFHCAAGRDRTGLVAALTLSLIEVERGEIVKDFLASNRYAEKIATKLRQNPLYVHQSSNGIQPALLQRRTMEHFLDLLDIRLGGARGWAAQVGISSECIQALRTGLVPAPSDRRETDKN